MMSLTTYKEDEDRINMISKDIYLGYSTLRATSQVSVQKEEKYEKSMSHHQPTACSPFRGIKVSIVGRSDPEKVPQAV